MAKKLRAVSAAIQQHVSKQDIVTLLARGNTDQISQSILDNVMMGVTIIDPDLKVVWLNKTFRQWFPHVDYKQNPFCYKSFYSPPKEKSCSFCPTVKAFKNGQVHTALTETCSNGRKYTVISTPIKDVKGRVQYVLETVEDVTVRKRIEEALKDSESQYRSMIDSMGESIHVVDRNLRFTLFNVALKKWCESLGLETEVLGRKVQEIFPFLPASVRAEYQKVFKTGKVLVTEETNKVGVKSFITETRKIPLYEGNKVTRVVTVIRDITHHRLSDKKLQHLNVELKRTNSKLKQLVLRDAQTGLFNHRYLGEIIDAEFYRAKRQGHPLAIIMMDIDYFKSINDVYGHKFGDLVLKQLARHLKKMLRQYDIVIRFGGEEFLIISPATDRATALSLGQRILEAMALCNFGDKNQLVKLKLSIAVTSFPEDKAAMGMELIELSEQVLEKVKQSGGNNVFTALDLNKERQGVLEKKEDGSDVGILKEKIDKLTKEANQSLIEAVLAFAKTLEVKDHYSGEHVERTVLYAMEIARALNLSKGEIERIKQASILHDLGKIGISEKILLKRAKLTKQEFEEIKKHPKIGVDIIRPIQFLHALIPLILYHHERWDGKGYPHGLKGDDIPKGARIIALADVYQALTSDRPYRKAFTKDEAIKIIREGSGTQFDPAIVNVFLDILEKEA